MWESYFGFKKTPFSDSPDAKQLFASEAWNQVKTRLEFLANHHGVGLLKSPFLEDELGTTGLAVLRALKRAVDPAGVLNPGKL